MSNLEYQRTHPWITFRINLDNASPNFWMLMGEARSKCDHISFVPLAPDTARRLMQVYFAKGVNATTAIEGNTLSEDQVLERIEGRLKLPLSQEYLGVEIDNMIAAYNLIIESLSGDRQIPVNLDTLCAFNRQILAGLELEAEVNPGNLRQHSVVAGSYLGAPWQDVPELLSQLCSWLSQGFEAPTPNQQIPYAFIKAVTAHVYLEWIHPFGDGNGRLGRLVEFLILVTSGVPVPAAHVLTSHYNDTRGEYYRQLHLASRNGGDLRPFLSYAAQGFVDGLTSAIKNLHRQQEELMWQALVDEAFEDLHSAAAKRQRLLALEAGRSRKWLSRAELRALVLALNDDYALKTPKTLSRDINRLLELGLLERRGTKFRASLSMVRGMRPLVVGGDR